MKTVIVVIGVIKKSSKYLLTKRVHKDKLFHDKWQFPGGALDGAETMQECLAREIREETNFDLKKCLLIPKIFEKFFNNWHYIFICYIYQPKNINKKIILDKEASEYRWFTIDEIAELNCLDLTYEIAQEAEKIPPEQISQEICTGKVIDDG